MVEEQHDHRRHGDQRDERGEAGASPTAPSHPARAARGRGQRHGAIRAVAAEGAAHRLRALSSDRRGRLGQPRAGGRIRRLRRQPGDLISAAAGASRRATGRGGRGGFARRGLLAGRLVGVLGERTGRGGVAGRGLVDGLIGVPGERARGRVVVCSECVGTVALARGELAGGAARRRRGVVRRERLGAHDLGSGRFVTGGVLAQRERGVLGLLAGGWLPALGRLAHRHRVGGVGRGAPHQLGCGIGVLAVTAGRRRERCRLGLLERRGAGRGRIGVGRRGIERLLEWCLQRRRLRLRARRVRRLFGRRRVADGSGRLPLARWLLERQRLLGRLHSRALGAATFAVEAIAFAFLAGPFGA